mmetsp:Transcript_10329/g.22489  ORF Transcript_10329/g.22489 Transcript_10329/m.22489 type:complete len:223 (-) Transcript_10329:153-821(-)
MPHMPLFATLLCAALVPTTSFRAAMPSRSVPLATTSRRPSTFAYNGLATSVVLPLATLPGASRHMPVAMAAKEIPLRSFVKAAGWRFTAGLVTAASSYIFTGSLATAASIVGWDLISKSGTMFIGERLWNNVKWGKGKTGDSSKRSLAKALAWRLFAAINTLFAATVLTKGKAGVASKIAGADSVVKTVLFFFYERAWAVVPWGKYFEEDPVEASADVVESA